MYHRFPLTEETKIKEIDSIARVFEHVKSGARLLHLENKDDNKVFSIAFRTTPKDDTGVPHIIEHAVLCGSKKFRTKDVFTDMAKSSLNTFINAMTFPDKTCYPISSRNHKDFLNLMEVYLDAVFYPNIYENHELLRQEGWRYEFDEETGKLIYKGIVYSEMQGALSSPKESLERNILASLFPNTTYAAYSGGDPEAIPDLTQEDFEDFHRKYYHPANSYIYLYGDQDLNECLRLINEEYLINFDRIEVPSHIEDVKPFTEMVEKTAEYSISAEEEEKNKTLMALGFVTGEAKDPETYLSMKVLNNMLIESSASPLKKALLDAEIGEGVIDLSIDSLKKTIFTVAINNTNEDKKDKFKGIVFDTLNSLVKNGIDKKLVEAAINSIEFELREAELWRMSNKGMRYNFTVMDSWLYEGNPTIHLAYEQVLNEIKRKMEDKYFEELIEKSILNNSHSSLVVLKPNKGLAESKAKELEDKLQKYKKTLSEDEIKALRERNARLKEMQMRENTPEQIATLPKLPLSEISKEIEKIPQSMVEKDGIKFLSHDIKSNGVAYISLLFDANVIEEKYIPYLGLLRDILSEVDTEDKTYLELNTEVFRKTGGISFETEVYTEAENSDRYHAKFILKSKVLPQNIESLFELINEIITTTKFDDVKRIREVVQDVKTEVKRQMVNSGNRIAMIRAASYFSKASKYKDMISGAGYYEFICDVEKNFDKKHSEVKEALRSVFKTIFNKNNLIVSYTGDEGYSDIVNEKLHIILNNLRNENLEAIEIGFEPSRDVEAIITASNVQYVARAFNYKKLGYKYSGKMRVLQNIIDSEYLYTRVRLQGGAYGCYMNLDELGNMAVASYRDPNLVETIKTYDETNQFLKGIDYPAGNMEGFIIGAIGGLDQPLKADEKGSAAVRNYICGITDEDIQRERDELLSTTLEDMKAFADMIKKGMEEKYCCVVGNELKINENKNVFDRIITLL
jgi:Zn-dependent M16 (insulinase) family peptidase